MAASRVFIVLLVVVLAVLLSRETFNPSLLKDKKVLITGGSSGIGEQIAYQYSRYGAIVVLVARREKQLARVVSKCLELGAKQAFYIVADLSSLEEAKIVHSKTLQIISDIDILVLNHVKPFSQNWVVNMDLPKVSSYFQVNTLSYINLASLFLPQLKKSNGSIIVVSSVAGIMGIFKETVYSANKHALHGFFNSLRQDLILTGNRQLSITTCIIGPIDTAGKVHFKNHDKMYWYPADKCALAIIKGGALKLRQMYYPYMLTKLTEFGYFYFPELFETVAQVYSHEIELSDGIYRYLRLN